MREIEFRVRGVVCACVAVAAMAVPAGAAAATITVNTSQDNGSNPMGSCTLRDAIAAANANTPTGGCVTGDADPALDTIQFDMSAGHVDAATGAQVRGTSLPTIIGHTAISGPGATVLSIHKASSADFRILAVSAAGNLSVSGVTIAGGSLLDDSGAGIVNNGTLSLDGVTVSGNSVTRASVGNTYAGGGVSNTGTLSIDRSTVSGNSVTVSRLGSAIAFGGGVVNFGTLHVDRSTISGNTVSALNTGTGSTVNDNTLARGAGIENSFGASGNTTVTRSTISGNSATAGGANNAADAYGGGLYNEGTTLLAVDRSTIAGNSAIASVTGTGTTFSQGGGAYLQSGSVAGSTIASNTTPAGGVANLLSGGGGVTVTDTILADPVGGLNCGGSAASGGHDLEDDPGASCAFTSVNQDLVGVDPMLGPLAANGGPTMTMALPAASPAVDAGASAGALSDQRELARVADQPAVANATAGDGSDIGAFELGLPTSTNPPPPPSQPPAAKKCKKKKKHKGASRAKSCKKKKKKH